MLNEKLQSQLTDKILESSDAKKLLELAHQSHENYLIRSRENDLNQAVSYYFQAIKLDPSISESYYKLAILLWDKGQIDICTAIEQCEKAIKLDNKSYMAKLYLGYFLKQAGRLSESETQLLESIKLNRLKSGKARLVLSSTIIQRIISSSKDFKSIFKAMYYFLSGLSLLSIDFNTHRVLCKSLLEDVNTLNYKISKTLFKKFKNYSFAAKLYENTAEYTGRINMYYTEIADVAIKNGNTKDAIKYYKNAIKNSPDNIELWIRLTNILRANDEENVDELLKCYQKVAQLDNQNAKAFYEIGHLYLKKEDKFNAVTNFKKAIKIDPKNAYYYNSLAYTLVQLQDFDGAISQYQKAIKLNPDKTWTSIVAQALGAIYHQVKVNLDAAILAYHTSVLLDPKNIDAHIALGEAYYDNNDMSNAIDCFCEAINLDSSIPRIYCCLGLALWEKDFADEASIAYQKAISLNPEYDLALNNLGVVYLDGLGKTEEALNYFNKALKVNPNYALAYFNQGRAYQILNNKTDAANAFQMAVDINKITKEFNEDIVIEKIYSLFKV